MRKKEFKISYVKKPFARNSLTAMGLTLVSFLFFYLSVRLGVNHQGQAELNAGGFAFCSLLLSLFGGVYGGISFWEEEKNYILSKISLIVCGLLLIFWVCMIIVGLRG